MALEDDLPEHPENPSFARERARRAARDPKRPGERCRAMPGAYAPRIDRSRCEGKAACAEVCPFGVFEVRGIEDDDFRQLSWLGRLKSAAHGRLTAYTPGADQCRACGLCVAACPEGAITLERPGKS